MRALHTLRRHGLIVARTGLAAMALSLAVSPPALAAAQADTDYTEAAVFPGFEIEDCCQLCPAAASPGSYGTSFLRSFTMLREGTNGWLFRSDDDLRISFGPSEEGLRDLVRLNNALKRRGVTLGMGIQPPRGLMHREKLAPADRAAYNHELAQFSYTNMLKRIRAAGIVVPDLERLVYERGGPDFFFKADHHWTPEGARRTAVLSADSIRALPQYDQIEHRRFVTQPAGLFAKRGTLHRAAERICGFGAPAQYVRTYTTEPADDADGASLLGEAEAPPVILVGTSNSDPTYNFAGFMSEALGIDVLNASIAGGGMDGAMLAYMRSAEFQDSPPKLMVWELEAYHNISDPEFYRQAIPLVDDGCLRKTAVLKDAHALRPGRNEILFNGNGQVRELHSRDHLIDLKFSDPAVTDLEAVVWYTNGRRDTVSLEADHSDGKGRFLFELRADGDWGDFTFLSLDVELPPDAAAGKHLEARLCERTRSAKPMQTAGAMP